ncbi:MAG: tetratricopeptide repeat protein [Candidatus Omnitrophica bacterium]|nr:tetratricopeptide repeat protein [Candidatus Omnitrophota bacterium]
MADERAYAQYYHTGVDLYAAGHYDEALIHFKKTVLLQPDFPDAYFKIACIYSELKLYPDAFSLYEKVVGLLPNDLEILWMYGKTLLKAGEEKKGVKILKKGMKLNRRDPRCRLELARYYVHIEQWQKAQALLENGLKWNPGCAPYYSLAGDISRKRKKYAKAQEYFEKCLELEPDNEFARRGFNAAMRAVANGGEKDSAHQPEESGREEMLGAAALYANGEYDKAIVRLLDLKDQSGLDREASMLLGLAFARKGLYKRAHDVLLAFTEVHSPDILVWYNLGLAASRMGRYEDAIDYLAEALEMDEDFEEALIEMGIACQMIGEIPHAQRYFLHALKINKNDARPYAYLARMAFDRDDKARVDEFLRRAKKCDPGHPSISFFEGCAAMVEGDFHAAVEKLDACLLQTPDHFEALKLLGRAQLELHDLEGGLQSYKSASSLNPSDPECRQVLQELAGG